MSPDSQVEGVFARCLGDIFVGADTSSFQSLARQLLVLIGDKVSAEGELVNIGTLAPQIEDSDLFHVLSKEIKQLLGNELTNFGIRDTAIVAGFRVRLIFAITVATSWTATHLDSKANPNVSISS
jgi:hypothetical protein